LNKTHFELIKELNKQQKEKDNTIPERSKKYIKSEYHPKKAHNKLESFILNSKKDYSKYNKVPHKSNITIDINTGVLHQTRGSDINSFNYYKTKPYKSFISEIVAPNSRAFYAYNLYVFKVSISFLVLGHGFFVINNAATYLYNKSFKVNFFIGLINSASVDLFLDIVDATDNQTFLSIFLKLIFLDISFSSVLMILAMSFIIDSYSLLFIYYIKIILYIYLNNDFMINVFKYTKI
jgi:hypothetical protein